MRLVRRQVRLTITVLMHSCAHFLLHRWKLALSILTPFVHGLLRYFRRMSIPGISILIFLWISIINFNDMDVGSIFAYIKWLWLPDRLLFREVLFGGSLTLNMFDLPIIQVVRVLRHHVLRVMGPWVHHKMLMMRVCVRQIRARQLLVSI